MAGMKADSMAVLKVVPKVEKMASEKADSMAA